MHNLLGTLLYRYQDQPPLQISLRSLLAIPLIAQIVVVTFLTGWLSHRNGQQVVQELADQLLEEMGDYLKHQLENYTSSRGDKPVKRLMNKEKSHLMVKKGGQSY